MTMVKTQTASSALCGLAVPFGDFNAASRVLGAAFRSYDLHPPRRGACTPSACFCLGAGRKEKKRNAGK